MLRDSEAPQYSDLLGLIVGNYCHDVLLRDGAVVGETIGGSSSFISAVLDCFSISHHLVAKVGPDFTYLTEHPPIVTPSSKTTVFHAYFNLDIEASGDLDRVLKRSALAMRLGFRTFRNQSSISQWPLVLVEKYCWRLWREWLRFVTKCLLMFRL